jgi:hypothetical protein
MTCSPSFRCVLNDLVMRIRACSDVSHDEQAHVLAPFSNPTST